MILKQELIFDNEIKEELPKNIFKGVSFDEKQQLWESRLQNNNQRYFLGYYDNEITAAQIYNDFALYINQTENSNFKLNDIPGYITVPRNIPELNKLQIQEKKSSKYNGVSYDSRRKYYVAGIRLGRKTYNLGNGLEIDCAKLYNQQALFFNNTLSTTYILNEIPNYTTTPKDISTELLENKKNKKSSQYHGVSFNKLANKWECSYMLNRKKNHIGSFLTELEAAESYNKAVIELNNKGFNYKINVF